MPAEHNLPFAASLEVVCSHSHEPCSVKDAEGSALQPDGEVLDLLYVLSGEGYVVAADGSPPRSVQAGDALLSLHASTRIMCGNGHAGSDSSGEDDKEQLAVLRFHIPRAYVHGTGPASAAPRMHPAQVERMLSVVGASQRVQVPLSPSEVETIMQAARHRASHVMSDLYSDASVSGGSGGAAAPHARASAAQQPGSAPSTSEAAPPGAEQQQQAAAGSVRRPLRVRALLPHTAAAGASSPARKQPRAPARLAASAAALARALARSLAQLAGRGTLAASLLLRGTSPSPSAAAAEAAVAAAVPRAQLAGAGIGGAAFEPGSSGGGSGGGAGASPDAAGPVGAAPPCVLMQRAMREFRAFRFPRQTNKLAFVFDPAELGLSLSFGVEVFEPGHRTPVHVHPNAYELFFVLAGQGVAYCDGDRFPVRAGDVAVFPPRSKHGLDNETGSKLYCLQLMAPNEAFVEHVQSGTHVGRLDDEDICNLTATLC